MIRDRLAQIRRLLSEDGKAPDCSATPISTLGSWVPKAAPLRSPARSRVLWLHNSLPQQPLERQLQARRDAPLHREGHERAHQAAERVHRGVFEPPVARAGTGNADEVAQALGRVRLDVEDQQVLGRDLAQDGGVVRFPLGTQTVGNLRRIGRAEAQPVVAEAFPAQAATTSETSTPSASSNTSSSAWSDGGSCTGTWSAPPDSRGWGGSGLARGLIDLRHFHYELLSQLNGFGC